VDSALTIVYSRLNGPDGQLKFIDTMPQLKLIHKLFKIYTDLGVIWRAPIPLLV
jgi:hypothetical protein